MKPQQAVLGTEELGVIVLLALWVEALMEVSMNLSLWEVVEVHRAVILAEMGAVP